MSFRSITLLLALFVVAGCAGEREVIAEATKTARDHCESEGKQFVPTKTEIGSPQDTFFRKQIKVEGVCVGPGEPGYVAVLPAH
ncbi:MAG: hypothetical protein P4L57_12260 [Rhizomicrobium sp.]|nr:hypothetical protein [Rhizomicrobium sp.]